MSLFPQSRPFDSRLPSSAAPVSPLNDTIGSRSICHITALQSVLTAPLKSTTPARTQPGHHTLHSTRQLQTPCATQPLATSNSIPPTSIFKYQLSAQSVAGGERASQSRVVGILRATARLRCLSLMPAEDRRGSGRTKPSGQASKPTVSASEKLRVAHVESVAPRKSSEKDCMVCSCCEDVRAYRTRRIER